MKIFLVLHVLPPDDAELSRTGRDFMGRADMSRIYETITYYTEGNKGQ